MPLTQWQIIGNQERGALGKIRCKFGEVHVKEEGESGLGEFLNESHTSLFLFVCHLSLFAILSILEIRTLQLQRVWKQSRTS